MPLACFFFFDPFYNHLGRQGHTFSLGFGLHAKEVARRLNKLGVYFEIAAAGSVRVPCGAGKIMDIFTIRQFRPVLKYRLRQMLALCR